LQYFEILLSIPLFPPNILTHKPFSVGLGVLYGPLILHMLVTAVHSRPVNEFIVTTIFKPFWPGHFSKLKTSESWKGLLTLTRTRVLSMLTL
jgi:hypothetical protein